jgi:hypothetical protein
MPVSSEENRIRGRTLWGLPKEVRCIRLRQVGAEWVTTLQDAQGCPSVELRVPKAGRTRPLPAGITVVSNKGEALLEGKSSSEGEGAVSYFSGRLWLSGDSEEARLLRMLRLSRVALRTQVATDVRSTFSLPELRSAP